MYVLHHIQNGSEGSRLSQITDKPTGRVGSSATVVRDTIMFLQSFANVSRYKGLSMNVEGSRL